MSLEYLWYHKVKKKKKSAQNEQQKNNGGILKGDISQPEVLSMTNVGIPWANT